jgi:CRP-like cAMP-binding protein
MTLTPQHRRQLLQQPMLSLLPEQAQEALLNETLYREYPAHALIMRQGEAAERFFVVLGGKVKLFRISADGKEKVVEIIQTGHTFAEAVMFMQKQVYPVWAEALESVRLAAVPSKLMLHCLQNNPQSCLHLLGHLSVRLHQRLDELENLTLQNATQRFALYLVGQVKDRREDEAELDLLLPKGLIAARLSIKPETLSRAMATLRDRGLIESHARHIRIPSVEKLLNTFTLQAQGVN